MLRNYIKIAWRNLKKNKGYSFINTLGLAVGVACCILVGLYVYHELSYESHHENAEKIYRVSQKLNVSGNEIIAANTTAPLSYIAKELLPEVDNAVGLSPTSTELLEYNDVHAREKGVYYADPSIFDIFTIPFIKGDPSTALSAPNTAVISQKLAKKYFGDEDPIGKTITVDEEIPHEIVGVIKNSPSSTTHHFNFIYALPNTPVSNWDSNVSATNYLLVNAGTDIAALENKLLDLTKSRSEKPYLQEYQLEPLDQIYLPRLLSGSDELRYIYIFSLVAFFLLLIACINHVNLSIARMLPRSQEVGVRKVMGAKRWQLALQYLTESFLISFFALIIAMGFVELVYPLVNALPGIALASFSMGSYQLWGVLLLLAVVIGLLSGSYISFYLSRLKPTAIFQNRVPSRSGNLVLQKGLITFQFVISIALICCTFIVQHQLEFIQDSDLGFDKEHMLVIEIDRSLSNKANILKADIEGLPGIEAVTASNGIPGSGGFFSLVLGEDNPLSRITYGTVDKDYFETMNISFISKEDEHLDEGDYVFNQAAAEILGIKEATGQSKNFIGDEMQKVAAITDDYNFESLHQDIDPLMLEIGTQSFQKIGVRLTSGNTEQTLDRIRSSWDKFAPTLPLVYSFLDDRIETMYRSDKRFARLFWGFSLITILIASMGLFGLASLAAQRRTKEIGIRKVLGATITNIVGLLSKDFLKLVALGFIIAVPIAYYAMNWWLKDFAYKIEIGPGIFLLAGGLALFIALATVSWQSIRAALANPVDSLRSE